MKTAFEVVAHPPPQEGEEVPAYDSKGRKRKVVVMEVMPGPGKKWIVKGDDGKEYTTANQKDSDHCKVCGSSNLWSNFFDADGFGSGKRRTIREWKRDQRASDGNGPTDTWQTRCGDCGSVQ